jgi:hypothetical protein
VGTVPGEPENPPFEQERFKPAHVKSPSDRLRLKDPFLAGPELFNWFFPIVLASLRKQTISFRNPEKKSESQIQNV